MNYNDWMEDDGEDCPECGFVSPQRQISKMGMCERCEDCFADVPEFLVFVFHCDHQPL